MKFRAYAIAAAAAVALVLPAIFAGPVGAAPLPAGTDFYVPPSPLPAGSPGDILRAEPAPVALSLPGADGPLPAQATRIMYRSNDTHGSPVAVTGTYLDPGTVWSGPGPRPLVSLSVGTHGQGDQCAPSRLFGQVAQYTPPLDVMTEYEIGAIVALLARGIAVVVTDYNGLGTPGVHDYLNRLSEAHAVLDAARAAQRLPGTKISGNGPVGLFGYSQGGGAAAAAAELQPSYAPELDLRGAFLGAPAVDLLAVLGALDGTVAKGFIGFALNSVAADYPEARPEIDRILSPAGKAMTNDVANMCLIEAIARYGLLPTSSSAWTTTGQPLSAAIAANPTLNRLFAEQHIGSLTPKAPLLMLSNVSDELVPNWTVRRAAADWCARGVTVRLDVPDVPPIAPITGGVHGLTGTLAPIPASAWMADRFAGVPAPNNCGTR